MKHIAKRISSEYLIYFAAIVLTVLFGVNIALEEIQYVYPIIVHEHTEDQTLNSAAERDMATDRLTLVVDNAYIEGMYSNNNQTINNITKSDPVQIINNTNLDTIDQEDTESTPDIVITEVESEPVQLTLVADTNDVSKPSNATVDELNNAIKSTCKWMYEYNPNLGEVYYRLEQEFGINAYFALSVSMSEVGVDDMSNVAKTKNNTYGIMGKSSFKSFDSVEECVRYFFNLIDKYYVDSGRYTVKSISDKYCVGDPKWVKNVSYFMSVLPKRSRI